VQGDYYDSDPNPDGQISVDTSGGNLLGRWRHTFSERSDAQLQFYYDRTERDFNNGFTEQLDTYDLDWQHRLPFGGYQEIVWGLGVRVQQHEVTNLQLFAFLPASRTLTLYNVFAQDEISLYDAALKLTLGVKLEHNVYTDWESQPNARLAWTPNDNHTLWAAASRAVRTPSRTDSDFQLFLLPNLQFIQRSNSESETVDAYEVGWRTQPLASLTGSLSAFFNQYDKLRSVEPGTGPLNLPVTFGNGVAGDTYGVELAANYVVTDNWQLRGGYTWLRKDLRVKPGSGDLNNAGAESNDPEHQFLVQSLLSLPHDLQVDTVLRYVDTLSTPPVDSYIELNARIAWQITDHFELSLVGQNLLDNRHPEFVPASPSAREIERAVYGKIVWRY
jgi:iron complex outermembrane recepter protein